MQLPPGGEPLERLYERDGLPAIALPPGLAAAYGGDLGFAAPCVYANFVASVDGVVALHTEDESGHIISGGNEADRFVMGLLRAFAGAVLVGAGTFRKTKGHLWQAEHIYPPAAPLFTELRRKLGLPPVPPLVLVTASGAIDTAHRALRHGALIVTTPAGELRLRGKVPTQTRLVVPGPAPIRLGSVVELLRSEGVGLLLTEGGPTLAGQLAAEGAIDELFLTISPSLYGRLTNDGRKSLVDGADLAGAPLGLLSARRHGSYLFLRYSLRRTR